MSNPTRPVSGFEPIGDVADGLELPGGRGLTPDAPRRFTRSDQVAQLVGARDAVDVDVGFMARMLALCSLPRTNPGHQKEYVRRNGPYALIMSAGGLNKLPYGTLPRLLLAWVCTEAVRTHRRELVLGRSLAEFMRKLGVLSSDSGGTTGVRTRLRNQMDRLFSCQIELIYEHEHGKKFIASRIADSGEFWWNSKRPAAPAFWESKIELGEKFFNEIVTHPMPLDMAILQALTRSPLGLDLYLWLTYRTFALKGPLRLSWRQVYRQFGVDPLRASDMNTVQNFRRKVLRELKKIKMAWPGFDYGTARGRLILLPSTPRVPLRLVE